MDTATIGRIKKLVEQSQNYDADERAMALYDLTKEMTAAPTLDASLQIPIRNALIARLQDKNGTVKTAAVRWLTETAAKFDSEHIIYIADKLGGMVVEQKKAAKGGESTEEGSVRDFADGLLNLLTVLNDDNAKTIAPNLASHLYKGLTQPPTKDTELEMVCLDLLQQLIRRFGNFMNGDVESDGKKKSNTDKLLEALQVLLGHPDENVRERTSFTIGPLVLILSEKPFTQMIESVIAQIEKSKKPDLYIKTIGAVSQSAGLRVSTYLPKIVPPLIKFCQADESAMTDSDNEDRIKLWTNCLSALGSIIKSCPTSVEPYLKKIVQLSLQLMKYDPHYLEEDEKMETGGGEDDPWGGGGGGDDEGWGDEPAAKSGGGGGGGGDAGGWDGYVQGSASVDSDESWKVRRAAVRILTIFVQYQGDKLKTYYADICDAMVTRFKERDVNVKEDILLATGELLKEGVVIEQQARGRSDDDIPALTIPLLIRTRSTYETLDLKTEAIINGLHKQFIATGADPRTKKAIFSVLSQLTIVRRGDLDEHLSNLAPHITAGIAAEGKSDIISADAIKFLHLVLEFHKFASLKAYIPEWTAALIKAIKKGQNTADALHALGAVAKKASGESLPTVIADIFKTTLEKMEEKDVDEKIKIAAIATMGNILAGFSDVVTKQIPATLVLFGERLRNETTRKVSLRALTKVASGQNKTDLRPIITSSLAEMTTFMRKSDSDLRHITAGTVEALIKRHAGDIKKDQYDTVLAEVATHIGDEDLMMASHCLNLVSTALRVAATATAAPVGKDIIPKAIKLVTSGLLQGQALLSLISFFQQCVSTEAKVKELSFAYLQPALLGLVTEALAKDNVKAVAKCVAGIIEKASTSEADKAVEKFVGDIKSAKTSHMKNAALLILGELGKLRDLSGQSGLEDVVFSAFSDPSVQQSAAYALGNISVGNLTHYLPILLKLIQKHEDRLYLLLSSLNEIIKAKAEDSKSVEAFLPYIDTATTILQKYIEDKNEGVRSVVAESLGRLTTFKPSSFVPKIAAMTENKSALQRLAAVTAIRFSFNQHMDWSQLDDPLKKFLVLLKDSDLEVKRQACVMLTSLLSANAEILRREILASDVLPILYSETKAHPELIEEKDYVAVKVTIDHGLPLRKEVYTSLLALLQLTPKRLNMQEYLKYIQQGLVDHSIEIQIATYEIFNHIAKNHSEALLEMLDNLPTLLMQKVKDHLKVVKEAKTAQKEMDVLRAFVSSMVLFNKIPGVDLCTKYTKFFKQVCLTQLLQGMLQEITKAGHHITA